MIGRRKAVVAGGTTGKRRFRFSLNALAIQLSAFALSFTLVAVLVVSGSQAAFVEQNESVTEYVPLPTVAPPEDDGPGRPRVRTPAPTPTPTPTTPVPTPSAEAEPEPTEESEPTVAPEPTVEPAVPITAIALSDSDEGTAMFGNLTLAPGVTVDRCIEVTYDGNVGGDSVLLYAESVSGTLAPYLDLTIQMGADAPGSFGSCAGFSAPTTLYSGTLAGFAADHGSYTAGRSTWNPAEGRESRSFRFSLAVRDVPAAAGKTTAFGFSWRMEV